MIGGCVLPFPDPADNEFSWECFIAHMSHYIDHGHVREKCQQRKRVCRHRKNDQRDDADRDDSLQGMEGKSRPGCGVVRKMMCAVDQLKYTGQMHKPVCPVKVGIM